VALRANNMDAAAKNLEQVETSIRDQSVEVRSAIIGLKMSGGVEQGLVASAREFVDQCNRLDDLPLELEIVGEVEAAQLKNEQALQLFRILQEAVSNVRRHSRATEASIRLERKDGKLEMTIRDNGIGFDPFLTGLERKGHFGMQIMVERAHAIGAQIEIKSSPGRGTQVIVAFDV
jgi:two-component system sensor histidine kinase DegS